MAAKGKSEPQAVDVAAPLEGSDREVDYSKTTMNVVNDPKRPADFVAGSKNS